MFVPLAGQRRPGPLEDEDKNWLEKLFFGTNAYFEPVFLVARADMQRGGQEWTIELGPVP